MSKQKLWEFSVEVHDGEHEYTYNELCFARTQEEADAIARKYAERFLLSKMEVYARGDDGTPCQWIGRGAEYRIVECKGASEVTSIENLLANKVINVPNRRMRWIHGLILEASSSGVH